MPTYNAGGGVGYRSPSDMTSPPGLVGGGGGSPFAALNKLHEVRGEQQTSVRNVTAIVEKLKRRARAAESKLDDATEDVCRATEQAAAAAMARDQLRCARWNFALFLS